MLTKTEGAKLGIASWSLPWAIGVQGYPRPERPLGCVGLLEKAVEANVAVVQIADNLPLHELPDLELDQLREVAAAHGLTLEAGTRSLDPEHLTVVGDVNQAPVEARTNSVSSEGGKCCDGVCGCGSRAQLS